MTDRTGPETTIRRHDLDWVRIGAFGLLIIYHIALFFAPWGWHVNSRHPQPWIAAALALSNPWRLTLLFFVSGAAMSFLTRKLTPAGLAANRSRRLLPPLLFGIVVLVPPQAYFERVEQGRAGEGYLRFLGQYVADHASCLSAGCQAVPLNHLWFVLYIWAYAMLLAALLAWPPLLDRLSFALGRALSSYRALLLPILYLAAVRWFLFPDFGLTNRLFSDCYNHAMSFASFLAGFCLVPRPDFWASLDRTRWPALALAIGAGALLAWQTAQAGNRPLSADTWHALVYAAAQWGAIAAILGFSHRHLSNADGPVLRYLNDSIFTFYLVHQTIIVMTAHWIDPQPASAGTVALLLVVSTAIGCAISYEIGRRSGPFRPLFGIRSAPSRDRKI